jgi:hypothetical protein
VDQVLQILENNQLYVKIFKCSFGKQEVEYLSQIVSREGVKVDPKNIQAMKKWPTPKNINSPRIGSHKRGATIDNRKVEEVQKKN